MYYHTRFILLTRMLMIGYQYINNHRYLLGGGWSVCDNFDNIYCSPIQNLTLNISVSHLNFDTSNTLQFYLENVNNGQMWLLLNKFKFYFIYRTK